MVSGIHSRHTIRSEIAKWRRNSWTEFLWPRRRKVVITAATTPLPITPMIKISPEKETVTFLLVALLAFFSVCQPLQSHSQNMSLVLFWYFLPHAKEPKTSVLYSGFHAVDSVFQVPDSWFFVSGTWIPDSNFQLVGFPIPRTVFRISYTTTWEISAIWLAWSSGISA